MIVALLIGRKGSIGFPGKNLYPVLGRPLSLYPMMAAKASKLIDKVYLSTDCEDLMKLATENDIEIIARPKELCTHEAKGLDAFIHGFDLIKERNKDKDIELVVLMFCNAATILSDTIDEGIGILRLNPEYDSAVTVSRYNMYSPIRARKLGEDGLLHPFVPFERIGNPDFFNCNRDSQGNVYFADVCVSIVRPRCLENIEEGLLPQKWMGRKIYPLKQWGGLDVDYEWQIPQVEFWLKGHGFTETRVPCSNELKIRPKQHIDRIYRTPSENMHRYNKLRLDKNENVSGFEHNALKEALAAATPEFISSYPETDILYEKIAKMLNCQKENVIVTNGSDGAIKSVFEAFVESGDEVILLNPSYAMYDVYCDMFNAKKVIIDFEKGLNLSRRKIIECISNETKLIIIANPNSPTGTVIDEKNLLEIINLAGIRGVFVLIDEAYYDFYKKSVVPYINRYKNLIVTRTFSKAGGIASLRLGFAVAGPDIITSLYKTKPMYETNGMAVLFGDYILEHPEIVDGYVKAVGEGKSYFIARLKQLGIKIYDTHANFILLELPGINNKIARCLNDEGILVKGGYLHPSLEDTMRITLGPIKEMERFIDRFSYYLRKEQDVYLKDGKR